MPTITGGTDLSAGIETGLAQEAAYSPPGQTTRFDDA
jgi:hypothetical protein